jgi:MscS family membrane protein
MQYLESEFLENKVTDILWLVGIIIFGLLFRRFLADYFSKILYRFIRHDRIPIHTCVEMLRKPVGLFISLIFTYLASSFVHFPDAWHLPSVEVFGFRMVILKTFEGMIIFSITWIIISLIKFVALIFEERAALTPSKLDDQFVPFFRDLIIVVTSIFTFFVFLGVVFEVNVVALVTGLGIGGLAIALAARETLENLFASFTLFLDLPFLIGDNIQMDKVSGDVENIGFRSTRIRTNEGSIVSVPNRLLTAQAVENLSQKQFKKTRFILKLDVKTPSESLHDIVKKINQLTNNQILIYKKDPGSTRFEGFGENSLDISVSYNIDTQDATVFNQIKEEINFQIIDIIQSNGATFAVPFQH